jgi:predicted outer membrane repeat protein
MKNESHIPNGVAGLLLLMWMSSTVLAGAIIYVDPQAPGADHGSTWTDAYLCLQNALEGARAGDEIYVAQGLYKPDQRTIGLRTGSNHEIYASGKNDETFSLPEGVAVMGGYAGYTHTDPNTRDVDTYPSILSGDLHGNDIDLIDLQWQTLSDFIAAPTLRENSRTVVTATDVSSQTILDGFTITAGRCEGGSTMRSGRGSSTLALPAPAPGTEGAGLFVDSGSPVFVRCTFYRNTVQSPFDRSTGGAGVASNGGAATFRECTFQENIAFGDGGSSFGAGVLNYDDGALTLIDCTFQNNVTAGSASQHRGGAIANIRSDCNMTTCSFVGNQAIESEGGALYSWNCDTVVVTDCTFKGNGADLGGAVCNQEYCGVSLTRCTFLANEAADSGRDGIVYTPRLETIVSGQGGAVYNGDHSETTFLNCRFLGNTAANQGGAVYATGFPTIVNSTFSGNSAARGGAICCETIFLMDVINSTFTANQASEDGGAFYSLEGLVQLVNCILWDDAPQEHYPLDWATIASSDVQGYSGTDLGNINANPRFQDAAGADGVAGTLDDNLRLSLGSPCLDAGDDALLPESSTTDLDGLARITRNHVDMGAYEFDGPYRYYVDAVGGNDANDGWGRQEAFATIQKGIETAKDGYTVVVLPGVYNEEVNFDGKAITVSGSNGGAILEASGGYAVSFYTAERSTSILKNFAIRGSDVGIFIAGTSPTIQNVTLADNEFGIAAYAGANPDISNCILWRNIDGDLFDCTATYSCVEQGSEGEGNISEDPLFADANNADYHLLAEEGRFVPACGLWAFDDTTSLCVDAGNPWLNPRGELMPNGGRINMGAFGGTPEASMSEWPLSGDINRDGIVDAIDLEILNGQWLEEMPWLTEPTSEATNSLQPNPPRWDIDGQPHEVHDDGGAFDYYVEMTAGEVVSPDGPVEYFFECDADNAFSSSWQIERTYSVLVGRTSQGLRFRVRACDQSGNRTEWSDWVMAMPYETN